VFAFVIVIMKKCLQLLNFILYIFLEVTFVITPTSQCSQMYVL